MKKVLFIPFRFFDFVYDEKYYPGSKRKIKNKANCQLFVYEIIRANSLKIPDFRSSDLWEDTKFTRKVRKLKPVDIVLFNNKNTAYGSHIGLCVGTNKIIHLSKSVGYPTIWKFKDLLKKYKYFIGVKRLKIH